MVCNEVYYGSSFSSIGEVAESSSSNSVTTSRQQPSQSEPLFSLSGMSQKRPRISWNQENVDKTFLEACLHEITINGREGSSLKANSWKNVREKLKTEHDFIADQKQMKNRYDYLKAKFAAWTKLKNKFVNLYDPNKNKFNLEEEEWQMEIKSNKYVKALRTAPLLYPDVCIQLFDGATSSCGPSSKLPDPSKKLLVPYLNEDTDSNVTPIEQPRTSRDSQGTSEESENLIDLKIIEIGEEICKVAKLLLEKSDAGSVDACMDKLEKLEWGIEDPKYMTAILLFGESVDVRKVWLCLKPGYCETWVRFAGRKYGLL